MAITPNGYIQSRPTITAGGRNRLLTLHASEKMRVRNISEDQVAYVLDNWFLKGIDNTPGRELSYVYFAYIQERSKVLKVATSIDDERIITTHFDRRATDNLRTGTRGYFLAKYQVLEERDEGIIR